MTRKHFEAIAAILKAQRAPITLCASLAREFSEQNALFNTVRFLTACGH